MTWPIKKNDLDPPYRGQLCVNGAGVDLTGLTVRFLMTNADTGANKVAATAHVMTSTDVDNAGIDTTDYNGWVQYAWVTGDTDTVGVFKAEWEVTSAGKSRTFPPRGQLFIEVTEDLG